MDGKTVQKAPQIGEVWGVTRATCHNTEHWRRRPANSPRAIIHRREEVDLFLPTTHKNPVTRVTELNARAEDRARRQSIYLSYIRPEAQSPEPLQKKNK